MYPRAPPLQIFKYATALKTQVTGTESLSHSVSGSKLQSGASTVYPYLPMATNAPWSIFFWGGGMKNQFWGNEKV